MRFRMISILTILLLILGACQSPDGSNSGSKTKQEPPVSEQKAPAVSLKISLASFFAQPIATRNSQSISVGPKILTGQLLAENLNDLTTQTFDWKITVDPASWDAQSYKTIALPTGDYQFTLLLDFANMQFAGVSQYKVNASEADNVPMTLRPIVGARVASVEKVNQLGTFQLKYSPEELQVAAIKTPQVGVIIDEQNEQLITVNPETGFSDILINLEEGDYDISLNLYDGDQLKGTSTTSGSKTVVTAGNDIKMDIVPLHGEINLQIDLKDDEGLLDIVIPAEIIQEAGGLDRLKTELTIVTGNGSLQEFAPQVEQDPSGDYRLRQPFSTAGLTPFKFQTLFKDNSSAGQPLVGSCSFESSKFVYIQSLTCEMTLRKRAIITGRLLSTLAINVFDESMEALQAVVLTANGSQLGITGSGKFGNKGYLKSYLPAGDYTISAVAENYNQELRITLKPGEVRNIDICPSSDCESQPGADPSGDTNPVDPDPSGDTNPVDPDPSGDTNPVDPDPSGDTTPIDNPSDLPLLTIDNFEYMGGFRMDVSNPDGESYASLSYSPATMTYNPANNSLFIVSHSYHQGVGEIGIPEIVKSDDMHDFKVGKDLIQPFSKFHETDRVDTGIDEYFSVKGLELINGKLIVNYINWYDAGGKETDTTVVFDDAANLAESTIRGPFQVEGAAHASGWISPIPQEWRAALGGTYINGGPGGAIVSRLSNGPSAFVMTPENHLLTDMPNGSIPTLGLLDFPLSKMLYNKEIYGENLGYDADVMYNKDLRNDLWTINSAASYGFIVPGTNTYVTVGSSAGHNSGIGYKATQTDGNKCGGPCPYDPADKYQYYWLWKVTDLLKVKAGEMETYDVRPYRYGELKMPFTAGNLNGGAYDAKNGILYVALRHGDTIPRYSRTPLFLAYKITL